MHEMFVIAWFIGLLISIWVFYGTFGNAMLVDYFPEGRRWWMWPSRIAAMMYFAALVHWHPFQGGFPW
jgi:hypothetical protein